ncbi:hypothetical protein MSG28_012089 [Choristoneura fumiferana]|uniref:Uncharacterized protein n=1 Tax=Choristoneura fumiferana TaxID=7141 RepID=A0ACC0KC88_CHOFU|nr:hypothetical protein MSG28_012089 [Choristoneura fumiferana]
MSEKRVERVTRNEWASSEKRRVFACDGRLLAPLDSLVRGGRQADIAERDLISFVRFLSEKIVDSQSFPRWRRAVARSVRVAAAAESRSPEKKGYEIARNMSS